MSEIKFNLTLKKIKISVSFMLLFAIIMFLPTCQLSRQKSNFFPSHFASISSCSACLVGIIASSLKEARSMVENRSNQIQYDFYL